MNLKQYLRFAGKVIVTYFAASIRPKNPKDNGIIAGAVDELKGLNITVPQAEENFVAADFPPLPDRVMTEVRNIYDRYIRELVHCYW